jgi:hypothetical protein
MLSTALSRGRTRALAPAALLLLALCLLVAGAQAAMVTDASGDGRGADLPALALVPYPGVHPVPGLVPARDYDAGGEGVAYHDTEAANLGGAYRPAEGVDIETVGGITDVGWVRSGEWLTYTVNATEAGTFVLFVEAANPDATAKRVAVLADGGPVATVDLRPTGSFESFGNSNSTPFALSAGETAIRLSFDGVSRVNLLTLDFERIDTPGSTPEPTPAPELLVDTPGLHALDRDLATAWIGVQITSSDVVFDGMGHVIEGTGANATGVFVSGSGGGTPSVLITNVTVRNLTVRGCGSGLAMGIVSNSVVEDVLAEQNVVGLGIGGGTTTDDHLVRDSVFRENSRVGISAGYPAQGVAIEACSITGNGEGVDADLVRSSERTSNGIVDSTVSSNQAHGISLRETGFLIRNCTIGENGNDGIYVEHGGAEVVGCRIEENAGIGVESSDRGNSDIHGNRIEGNGQGVVVGGDWSSRVRNNYLNNTDNGFFGASTAGLLNYEKTAGRNIVGGPYLGGNFWAHPNGTGFSQTHADLDRDGICDEPFVMEFATDFLPLAPSPGTPVTEPTPFTPHPVPGRVEAEDYDIGGENVSYHDTTPGNTGGAYRQDDVDIETANGITDVGWIRDGEFLLYTLNVTEAGFYTMTARAATPNDGRTASVSVNAERMYGIRFTNTGSFSRYATVVGDDVYLPAGTVLLRLTFVGDGENLDWIAFAPRQSGPEPHPVPGTIQAEDYDPGGYVDTTPGNQGGAYRQDDVDIEVGGSGYDVGWIRTGESLSYTLNVPQGGAYELTARVASPNSGRTIAVSGADTPVTITVPNTGSFSTFRTVSVPVTLTSGFRVLQLAFTGDGQNLDWIAFAPAGAGTPTPTPSVTTPTPTPGAGGGSFSAAPLVAPKGSAVKFTLSPAAGKSVASVWWSFDAPAHLNTWNSRATNPTFYYPVAGTFSPLAKIAYRDGTTETVQRTNYVRAT